MLYARHTPLFSSSTSLGGSIVEGTEKKMLSVWDPNNEEKSIAKRRRWKKKRKKGNGTAPNNEGKSIDKRRRWKKKKKQGNGTRKREKDNRTVDFFNKLKTDSLVGAHRSLSLSVSLNSVPFLFLQ